tara:strand:- start:1214 stop:1885 length:672 start_codon:yes stop_codon:yes gene_type:complete
MNAVEELLQRQELDTVRQLYETVQHWPMADIRLLGEALQEPAIWITGDDAISKREQILMQGDKKLVSVLAGLKCFWMLDNTTATDIHFFDIRKDNLEIKKQMFDLFYVQREDYNTVYDWVLNNVDGRLLEQFDLNDELWTQVGKRNVDNCTFTWTLINVAQHPEYLIDNMDVTPGSIYLSNIFDDDNDSSWLYENTLDKLTKAVYDYRHAGGKVWMHNVNSLL